MKISLKFKIVTKGKKSRNVISEFKIIDVEKYLGEMSPKPMNRFWWSPEIRRHLQKVRREERKEAGEFILAHLTSCDHGEA